MPRRPIDKGPDTSGSEAERGLFEWVTDFDDPVAVKAAASKPHRGRGRAVPIAVGGGSLLVIGATVLAALLRPFEAESGMSPSAGPRVHDEPSGTPSATAEAPVASTVLPDDCADLYDASMTAEFERASMHLNRVWTGAREAPAGSTDAELIALLRAEPSLDCFWLDETGGMESAVLTVASEPGVDATQAIAARLLALGFSQQEDRGGVRYFTETRVDGETVGESHFLRDGVWLATNWYGFGPWGYTRHMAENVFS